MTVYTVYTVSSSVAAGKLQVTSEQCWAPDVPFHLADLESESEPPNRVSSPDLLYTYISVDPES